MNQESLDIYYSKESELLRRARGVIFTDLDGVWFDEDNNFAPPPKEALQAIKTTQDAGFVFIMNSDTGVDALINFSKELGFIGPIIAEKGSAIVWPSINFEQLLFPNSKKICSRIRSDFIKIMENRPDRQLWGGDATQFLRQNSTFDAELGKILYLINNSRKCSVGVYTRKIGANQTMIVDNSLTQETQQILANLIPNNDLCFYCKAYPNLGSCLVKSNQFSKVAGVSELLKYIPKTTPCWMIGDRVVDSMAELGNRIVTCAVGNAEAELKLIAQATNGIIAPNNLILEQGAQFIIQQIISS